MALPDFRPAVWQGEGFAPPLLDQEEFKARCRAATAQQLKALRATSDYRRWMNEKVERPKPTVQPMLPYWLAVVLVAACVAVAIGACISLISWPVQVRTCLLNFCILYDYGTVVLINAKMPSPSCTCTTLFCSEGRYIHMT